jgi:hypothetical protein
MCTFAHFLQNEINEGTVAVAQLLSGVKTHLMNPTCFHAHKDPKYVELGNGFSGGLEGVHSI